MPERCEVCKCELESGELLGICKACFNSDDECPDCGEADCECWEDDEDDDVG